MARKAKAKKAAESSPAVRPVKITLSIPPDLAARLRAAAGYRGVDPRDLVVESLSAHLAGFVVYARPGPGVTVPVTPPPAPGMEVAGAADAPQRSQDGPGPLRLHGAG